MLRFLAVVFLIEIALHGQSYAASNTTVHFPPQPSSPSGRTTHPPTTPTTPTPTTPPPTTTTPPPTPPPTPPTTTHTTITPITSTAKPVPPSTPSPPHPSDRKFDAFSFVGGFCLALGLVAIACLGWKFYISRRDNVYHTL